MRRLVLVAFLALLAFNVSGLGEVCGEPVCEEDCPTDVSGGQCPPNCHFCSCCSLPRALGPDPAGVFIPPVERARWAQPSQQPTSPEPDDILHVPIALPA